MTMTWPEWHRRHIDGLVNYVLPDEAGHLGAFPAKSGRDPVERLREIFDGLRAIGIRYEHEPVGASVGYQRIRPPHEVLAREGAAATCLDVSLVAAALCLHAGLHPYLVEVDGHAVLAVYVGDGQPAEVVNWDGGPNLAYPEADALDIAGLRRLGVRTSLEADGAVVAVDVSRATTGGDEPQLEFAAAVGTAADIVDVGTHPIRVCDIGWLWQAHNQLNPGVGWEVTAPLFPTSPFADPNVDWLSPAGLTRAQYRIVPFQESGVLHVLMDRMTTATSDSGPPVLLVHGQGGVGKSRLAAEVATSLAAKGWTSGIVHRGELEAGRVDLTRLSRVEGPLFVGVDYADATDTDRLTDLVRAVQGPTRHPSVVLLLARTDGYWWERFLEATATNQLRCRPHVVDQLPATAVGDRQLWRHAVRAFDARRDTVMAQANATSPPTNTPEGSGRAGRNDPSTAEVPELPPPPRAQRWSSLDLVLLAWLKVHHPDAEPKDRSSLYDTVLDHEYDYWRERRRGQSLPEPWQFRRWAAHLSVASPNEVMAARAIAADIDDASLNAFAAVWSGGWDGDGRTPSPLQLQPDSVGDHLCRRYFSSAPDEFAALASRVAAMASKGDDGPFERLVANMGRAETDSPDDPTLMTSLWAAALRDDPSLWRRLLPAAIHGSLGCGGAFERLLSDMQDVPDGEHDPLAEMANGLAASIPLSHGTLRRAAALAAQRAVHGLHDAPASRRAESLNNLGARLSEVGRRDEALSATREAVDLYRQLAESNPAAFLPDLAMSLNNLGNGLSEVGRRDDALTATSEAVDLYRQLAESNPAAFLPDLAMSLNNLGARLSDMGRRDDALTATSEAVDLYRQLADTNPEAFLPDLAMSLNNLGARLSDMGRRDDALTATSEAVTIRRQLAESNPAAFLPDLAMSLNNLGARLSEVGRRDEALTATREAVDLYRQLAESSPAAFLPDLAMSLNNLGARLSALGRRDEALTATREAVDLYRQLAESSPAAFLPDLAMSLNNLGARLSALGRRDEALTATSEAVTIRRQLAESNPAAFLPDLAMSLNNLGARLSEVGRRDEALTATSEAVTIRRQLAESNPAAFLPDLAGSLNNLGARLSALGRRDEALTATSEAVDLYRQLAESSPAAFLPDLAMSLNNLGVRLSALGRRDDALTATSEAVDLYRQLAESSPAAFLPDLAMSLNNLGARLSALGRRDDALTATREAVDLYRQLAESNPAAFLPNLAISLNNLGNMLSDMGRRDEALTATSEAVTIRRQLAESNPAAFLPDLAMSLNNLGARLSDMGRRDEALTATSEAVTIRRQLAESNPAAFLPDLAGSLNNLGTMLSEVGRRDDALTATSEAVDLYRQLAESNPAAFLPDLAMSLNNLGLRLSEMGRRDDALTATTEAADIYRQLAGANPAAFLPDLAMSLNNLGNGLSEVGRRDDALTATSEAADIYRQLAGANPAAFLPNLAISLNNLGTRLSDMGRRDDATAAWETAIDHLTSPVAAAWLTAMAPAHLVGDRLAEAATILDDETSDPLRGAARRAVAAIATQRGVSVGPRWLTHPLAPSTAEAVNGWLAATTWPEQSAWLSRFATADQLADVCEGVSLAAALWPEHAAIAQLAELLRRAESGEVDLDTERAAGDARWETHQTLIRWLATESWTESRRVLRQYRQMLTSGEARDLLHQLGVDERNGPIIARHLAIIDLLDSGLDDDDVFEWAADASALQAAALTALTEGDHDLIPAMIAVNPTVAVTEPYGWLMLWLTVVLDSDARSQLGTDGSEPADPFKEAIAGLSADARHATRLRLQRFAVNLDRDREQLHRDVAALIEALA